MWYPPVLVQKHFLWRHYTDQIKRLKVFPSYQAVP